MATGAVPATHFRRAVRAARPGTAATGPGPRELVQSYSAYRQNHIIGLHVMRLRGCLRPPHRLKETRLKTQLATALMGLALTIAPAAGRAAAPLASESLAAAEDVV